MTERPKQPDPLPPGYCLARRYVIESELPPATFGRVYKAVDKSLGTTVAVNVLAPAYCTDEGLGRFFWRVRTVYETKCRQIPESDWDRMPMRDVGQWDGLTFVVLVYIEGAGAAIDIALD